MKTSSNIFCNLWNRQSRNLCLPCNSLLRRLCTITHCRHCSFKLCTYCTLLRNQPSSSLRCSSESHCSGTSLSFSKGSGNNFKKVNNTHFSTLNKLDGLLNLSIAGICWSRADRGCSYCETRGCRKCMFVRLCTVHSWSGRACRLVPCCCIHLQQADMNTNCR